MRTPVQQTGAGERSRRSANGAYRTSGGKQLRRFFYRSTVLRIVPCVPSRQQQNALQETYRPRDFEKPVLDFAPILETLQTDIKIRIHKSVLDRVLEFCTQDRVTPDGEDYYLVNYPFIKRDYYYDILLSFGDKCECLEPGHVREEIKRRIQSMASLYRE